MREPANMGASVRARLLKLSKDRNQPFQLLLTRYVLERLLYRLSSTTHRDRFVLKGAMLMTTWFDDPFRPTQDLDLLGFGDPDPEAMLAVFREICAIKANDDVAFDVQALTIDRVRDELEYGGLRKETVIAEKFQAMVMLGRANSRMKDLYDIWVLSRCYEFTGDRLARAIAATFERRKTPIPIELPDALTQAFADDPTKQQQWISFVDNVAVQPGGLGDVISDLATFLMPHAEAARRSGKT